MESQSSQPLASLASRAPRSVCSDCSRTFALTARRTAHNGICNGLRCPRPQHITKRVISDAPIFLGSHIRASRGYARKLDYVEPSFASGEALVNLSTIASRYKRASLASSALRASQASLRSAASPSAKH